MKKTYYISGDRAMVAEFSAAAARLGAAGQDVVNPLQLPEAAVPHRHHYQAAGLQALLGSCTHIYMLRGWQASREAVQEHEAAVAHGLKTEYER